MRAELTHTPGPWTITKHIKAYEQDDNDYPGAEISFHEWDGKQWHEGAIRIYSESAEQDANLVAAAPEMLAVLKGLREACTEAYKAGRIEPLVFVTAGNVIAKAEGR